MKLSKISAVLSGLILLSAGGVVYAQSYNSMLRELQSEVIQNTGISREEGLQYYKVEMECKQRGFPHSNIWNRCIQPTYVQRGYQMPSSITGVAGFAAYQKCIPFKSDADVLLCMQGIGR